MAPAGVAAGCGAPEELWSVAGAEAARRACGESGGDAIAAEAAPCNGGCAEAGASAVANGFPDWLQDAAAKPSTAQTRGRMILIIGALQICGLQAAFPSSMFGLTI